MAEVEHDVKVFQVTEKLPEDIKQMEADGWRQQFGVPAVVIYHVIREKVQPGAQPVAAPGGLGKLTVDESKVLIIRDGKVVGPETMQ